MAGYSILSNVAVRDLASTVLFENIVQKIMVVPGRGAEFKYVQDLDAASVAIQRTNVITDGRILGSATNGGFFDDEYGALQSQIFELPLNIVATRPVKIAAVADTINGGLLLKSQLENVPKQIARVVNASYFATLLAGVLQGGAGITLTSAGGTVSAAVNPEYISAMATDDAPGALSAFNAAVANLGNGDLANGFDIFEMNNATLFGKSAYLSLLRNNIGGLFANSNLAQEMVASGSFTAFDTNYRPDMIDGYMGEIFGALVYIVGSLFTLAEGWLGLQTLSTGAIAASDALNGSTENLMGILVCGKAVGGGLDLRSEVKVVDARGGQGWEVQPNGRCGWTVFSPKGVQLITNSTGLTLGDFYAATGSGSDVTITQKLALLAPLCRA